MRSFYLLLALVLLSFQSYSQEIKTDSLDLILDMVTIQSDVFEHNSQEFAGSVTGITPLQISRSEGLYLQPVLNSTPGVYMQSGTLNTNRIAIRGIGSRSPFGTNKIKAYLDEIPLSTGDGETTIEDIDFSTLGGIEIYRGPSSTMYGAGLGGAIHMITARPENQNFGRIETTFGSFGLQKYQAGVQVGNTKRSVSIFYQNVMSEGYRENNAYDRQSVTTMAKTLLGEKSVLSLYMNASTLLAYIPSSLNEEDYINNPSAAAFVWGEAKGNEDNNRFRTGLSLNTTHNDRTESTVAIFLNTGNSDEIRPTFLGNTKANHTNFGIRGRTKRSFLSENQLNLVLGFETFLESYVYQEYENINGENGNMTLDYDQKRNYGNLFLASEYQPNEQWLFTLGANLNGSKYDLVDQLDPSVDGQSGDYAFEPIFSPKASVIRFFGKNISLYGLLAHGFSLPTFEETLYPGGLINDDLKPEIGWNYEIGLKGQTFDQRLTFELAGYLMKISNLIVSRMVDEVQIDVNAGHSDHKGLELMISHQIIKQDNFKLNQRLALTWMDYTFGEFVDGENDYSGNEVTGVPNRTVDYILSFDSKWGIYGNVNWQNVGAMPILDNNTLFSDAYNLVNLKLGYQKTIGSFDLNVYGGINNLLDEKYASMLQINATNLINPANSRYYYPGLPINYFGGAKIAYCF